MNWKSIRLELAGTQAFPQGSASRAYHLRLPVGDDGLIDAEAVLADPDLATVRRFWPNEPDARGRIVRTAKGWAIDCASPGTDGTALLHLDRPMILEGGSVTLVEPEGGRLPFRIACIQPLDWSKPALAGVKRTG